MTATQSRRAAVHAIASLTIALVAACAGSPAATGMPGTPAPEAPRAYPGFDAATYPGDATMQRWRAASPYRWVGYYLPAPCHRDATWAGTRARLEGMGWGIAVLYVGQQAWEGVPDRAPTDSAGAARPIICSRTLLTAQQGRIDADDAIAKAAADGFARGTVIYLDIEPVSTVSQAMKDYYRAWTRRVLEEGRYGPGLYAHQRNAVEIHADMRAVRAEAGATAAGDQPDVPVWVAAPSPTFSVVQAPRELGIDVATIWQGRVDVDEAWGGVTLRIDANVASTPSPSAP